MVDNGFTIMEAAMLVLVVLAEGVMLALLIKMDIMVHQILEVEQEVVRQIILIMLQEEMEALEL